jgi:hypothetical protein
MKRFLTSLSASAAVRRSLVGVRPLDLTPLLIGTGSPLQPTPELQQPVR